MKMDGCTRDPYFAVDANGTASEEKFGWSVTGTTNRVFTFERTNSQ